MNVMRMMLLGVTSAAMTALSALAAAAEDIMDILTRTPEMSSFTAAVKAAGLDGPLKGKGPFTVLVPTDAAFASQLGAVGLKNLMGDKKALSDVVKIHVLPNDYPTARLAKAYQNTFRITTPEGTSLLVDVTRLKGKKGPLLIAGVPITRPEITASNGTIYVLERVFLPVKHRAFAMPAAMPAAAAPAAAVRAPPPPPPAPAAAPAATKAIDTAPAPAPSTERSPPPAPTAPEPVRGPVIDLEKSAPPPAMPEAPVAK